jgi:hypothetical protein
MIHLHPENEDFGTGLSLYIDCQSPIAIAHIGSPPNTELFRTVERSNAWQEFIARLRRRWNDTPCPWISANNRQEGYAFTILLPFANLPQSLIEPLMEQIGRPITKELLSTRSINRITKHGENNQEIEFDNDDQVLLSHELMIFRTPINYKEHLPNHFLAGTQFIGNNQFLICVHHNN